MSITTRLNNLESTAFSESEIDQIALARSVYTELVGEKNFLPGEALTAVIELYPTVPSELYFIKPTGRLLEAEIRLDYLQQQRLLWDKPTAQQYALTHAKGILIQMPGVAFTEAIELIQDEKMYENKVDFAVVKDQLIRARINNEFTNPIEKD